MTLFHLSNCLALTYGPIYVIYKAKLAESGAMPNLIYAGFIYAITQLGKMLLMATFIPSGSDFVLEALKSLFNVIDLVGFYIVITRSTGDKDRKVLSAGLGWAAGEAIISRFLPIWIGARGQEFDWQYIQLSIRSNFDLFSHIALAALMHMHTRPTTAQNPQLKTTLSAGIAYITSFQLITVIAKYVLGLSSNWLLLSVHAALTASAVALAHKLYYAPQQQQQKQTK
eukprot:GEZU01007616.1.p1 GENE.GEZU01007616.1~~GEZU01007616.1.p1  ORF type:complete len:227 (-),score=38.49 GEZU01007616.1:62-742(-)